MRQMFKSLLGGTLLSIMLGSATPSSAQAIATPPQPRPHTIKVTFKFPPKADRKPVPFELVNGMLIFRAKVNGEMVWALLDNGADMSLIDKRFASDNKVAVGPIVSSLRTPSGTLERRVAREVPFELPGQVAVTAPFSVVDLRFVALAVGRPISMVMGKEYFANFTFVILPSRKTFEVGPSGSLRIPANIPFAPIENDRGRIQAEVGGHKLSLHIDLGANGQLLLGPTAWTLLGLEKAPQKSGWSVNADGRHSDVAITNLPRVTIGPFVQENVVVQSRPTILNGADGLVGLGFLSNFNFAIDVKGRKLWMLGPVKKAAATTSPTP